MFHIFSFWSFDSPYHDLFISIKSRAQSKEQTSCRTSAGQNSRVEYYVIIPAENNHIMIFYYCLYFCLHNQFASKDVLVAMYQLRVCFPLHFNDCSRVFPLIAVCFQEDPWHFRSSQTCRSISRELSERPEPPGGVIRLAPAVQNRCSSPALAAQRRPRRAAILGKLVKTTVAPQVDAATPRCNARRQSGKHRLNLGSTAPRAFVIWSGSSRQVAAAADECSSQTPSG